MISSSNTDDELSQLLQPPPVSLSQVYRDIAAKALVVDRWPDSTAANKIFPRDENGAYLVPSFPESEAPLAVAAILDRNQAAQRITSACDPIFATFVTELRSILASSSEDRLRKGDKDTVDSHSPQHLSEELEEKMVWRTREGTHHITVAVFQENPSILLDESDKLRWRPVEEQIAEKVYQEISTYQENTDTLWAPRLQLDSLLLTGDGAMIAGFVDQAESFQMIRMSCSKIAASIIGDLTSRPKKLVHFTVGRILALPQGTSPVQQQAVNRLVRLYNTQILPSKVTAIQNTLPRRASFELTELTMLRDVVWTLLKIKEYGSWHLRSATIVPD